jgi:hypothetical protein
VTRCQSAAIGHLYVDGCIGDARIDMGALGFKVVTRGAGVGDSVIVELGWGTA